MAAPLAARQGECLDTRENHPPFSKGDGKPEAETMNQKRKTVSVITPCYNEENNVALVRERVKKVFDSLPDYDHEHIFADNRSTDATLARLKEIAAKDPRVKVIANARNFGPARSLFNALLAARGDALVLLAADLQDPPELIAPFVKKWEEGYKIVFGVREKRREGRLMVWTRKIYYRLLNQISEDNLMNDSGDFVLFDKAVQDVLRCVKDNNPYVRGLLSSLGFRSAGIPYQMAARHSGKTKATVFGLFTLALNGFVNHTMFPIRLATFTGVALAAASILFALAQLILKLVFWDAAPKGIPTLIVGFFFLSGVQLFILGFLGEFVGAMYRQMKGLPLVVEEERINFTMSALEHLPAREAEGDARRETEPH
jgi:glycosyltransferase involved in cell wall biosynthesis